MPLPIHPAVKAPAESGLVRAITTRGLTASIVNATIGAGIFVLPATAAAELGSAAPLAYIVCAVAMGLVVTCFAGAGSRVSITGGLYAGVEAAFGPFVGFLAAILYWLSAVAAGATVANALVASVGIVLPDVAAGAGRVAFLLLLFSGLAAINVRGVKPGIRVVESMTAAKLLPLIALIAGGLWFFLTNAANPLNPVNPANPVTLMNLGRGSMVLIFAFIGVELALVPSGEVRNPERTVPRAIFAALAITTVVYIALQAVAQGLLGNELSAQAEAPLAEAASRLFGSAGRTFMLVGAAVSMSGYLSGDMLATPRTLYALALRNLGPMRLASVHARYHTPAAAIVAHAVIVSGLAVSSTFATLAVMTNVASLSLYLLAVGAAGQLQRRDVRADGPPFELPGGWAIPMVSAAIVIWLLAQATPREFAVEGIVLSLATFFYAIRRSRG